jgi:hypothetical protein
MRTAARPLGKAMYVASQSDKDWLQSVQRKLYTRSKNDLDYVFDKLWGLITDPCNLRIALERVARNKGHRTAGVDGVTVRRIVREGGDEFLRQLRIELRAGSYLPQPVRRVLIPKIGQPGKVPFEAARVRVRHFELGWQKDPSFACTSMESPVHNERCTPGSVRGARKPTRG